MLFFILYWRNGGYRNDNGNDDDTIMTYSSIVIAFNAVKYVFASYGALKVVPIRSKLDQIDSVS